jgi:RNA polymerase sigma factor (sigma-70 family)
LIFCRQRRLRSVLIYVMAGSYVNLRLVPNSGAARGAEPSMSDRSSRSRSEGEEWTHDARSRLVEELFAAHRTALLQYLTRLLHSSEDAEEIVQETYIRLLKLDDLSHLDSEVRRFLFRIATNLARDRFRQRKARAHDAHVPYDLLELEGSSEAPEEIVDWDAGMVVLKQALLDLPPRHRQVFLLHVTENMSYRTIAKHLGVSTKTVERDLAMVLELCQSRLRTMESK